MSTQPTINSPCIGVPTVTADAGRISNPVIIMSTQPTINSPCIGVPTVTADTGRISNPVIRMSTQPTINSPLCLCTYSDCGMTIIIVKKNSCCFEHFISFFVPPVVRVTEMCLTRNQVKKSRWLRHRLELHK